MFLRFLLLVWFHSSVNDAASISSKTLVFNSTADSLPAYYQDIASVETNHLIFKPSKSGKMIRLVRLFDSIEFELRHQSPDCSSK